LRYKDLATTLTIEYPHLHQLLKPYPVFTYHHHVATTRSNKDKHLEKSFFC